MHRKNCQLNLFKVFVAPFVLCACSATLWVAYLVLFSICQFQYLIDFSVTPFVRSHRPVSGSDFQFFFQSVSKSCGYWCIKTRSQKTKREKNTTNNTDTLRIKRHTKKNNVNTKHRTSNGKSWQKYVMCVFVLNFSASISISQLLWT